MIGTTLAEIRSRIESLASDTGQYYLVCGRTGARPVPAEDLSFASRVQARAAAHATEQYRATLRRYDPQLPCYDIVVCERHSTEQFEPDLATQPHEWKLSDPILDERTPRADRRPLVEFCHQVSAAVFETLSKDGHDAVETAVMDTYLELAERTADPDDLCLGLLEAMATELATQLDSAEQAAVLADAAARLPSTGASETPVRATLDWLCRCGLLKDHDWAGPSPAETGRSAVVRVAGYALSPTDGCLPVLPVALDLHRRELGQAPASVSAAAIGDDWQLTVEFVDAAEPEMLVRAPICES